MACRRVPAATLILTGAALLAIGGSGTGASAQGWSSTDVQLLYGRGYELGPPNRAILTFEHASGWNLGSNYFFFDVTQPFGEDTDIYGEWYSRLSWTRLGLRRERSGRLRDLSLAASVNAGSGFRAYLLGVTAHLSVPGFTFLDVDLMVYDDRSDPEVTYILTPAWALPFRVGKLAFRFQGFADLIGREGDRSAQLLTQPQLLLDVGALAGAEERFFAGVEVQYWCNKYGVRGTREALPQVMVLWRL